MTIEEKAKAYDALKDIISKSTTDKYGCIIGIKPFDLFPELAESEDERIRKVLVEYFNHVRYNGLDLKTTNVDEVLSWLEKQKDTLKDTFKDIEQKPEWSEEDDENIMMIEDRFSDYLDYIREDSSLTKHKKNSLKEEVIGYVNWLKSLRPQKQWKPSDEQMEILQYLCNTSSHPNEKVIPTLESLYNDLKKLREE